MVLERLSEPAFVWRPCSHATVKTQITDREKTVDYAEMLFALKMREHVITELSHEYPEQMAGPHKEQFISHHFERYLIDALEKVERTAYLIRDANHK